MRQGLSILAVAALITLVIDVMIGPNKTDATMTPAKSQFQNGASINGLHVALPENMKTFPVELVPLP
jgi:hypothetical protein